MTSQTATRLDLTLASDAVEALGEDAGLGAITEWVETHKEATQVEMLSQCLQAIAGLTHTEETNHEHLLVLAKTMAKITLERAA